MIYICPQTIVKAIRETSRYNSAAPERAVAVPFRCFEGCITSSDFLSQKPLADWGNKLDV